MNIRLFLLPACWLPMLALPSLASAHTLLLSRGDVSLQEDRVTVEIRVNGEDFLHGYDIATDVEGLVSTAELTAIAHQHEAVLEEALVIRDQSGVRLRSDGFRLDPHWSTNAARLSLRSVSLRYLATLQMPGQPSLLALHLFPSVSRTSTPWQVVLRVRGTSQEGRTVVLTDRGNLDIVRLDWDSGFPSVAGDSIQADHRQCRNCDRRGPEQLGEVCADIEIGGNQLTVDFQVPLPILATFKGIALAPRDFLSAAEQTAVLAAARDLLAEAVKVSLAGVPLDGELVALDTLNPFEKPAGKETISYWLGRARARLQFHSDSPLSRATIHWGLFNNAILTTQASIRSGNWCIGHEFSTYAPEYEWISR